MRNNMLFPHSLCSQVHKSWLTMPNCLEDCWGNGESSQFIKAKYKRIMTSNYWDELVSLIKIRPRPFNLREPGADRFLRSYQALWLYLISRLSPLPSLSAHLINVPLDLFCSTRKEEKNGTLRREKERAKWTRRDFLTDVFFYSSQQALTWKPQTETAQCFGNTAFHQIDKTDLPTCRLPVL